MRDRIGLVFTLVATLAAGLLTFQYFSGAALPGCGPTSACAELAAGPFGRLFALPVAFLGLAYFLALLVSGGYRATSPGVWVVRLGAVASLFYLGVMFAEQKWCLYCVVVHVANLLLVATLRPLTQETGLDTRYVGTWWYRFVGVLVAGTLLLNSAATRQAKRVAIAERNKATESTNTIIATFDQPTDDQPNGEGSATLLDDTSRTFTGRHRRGAEQSAIRLVIFQDYQCRECRSLESQLETLLAEHPATQVSIRQFPICAECNPTVHYTWFHPGACHAARVAEAAESLGGETSFWIAHKWLFERKAKFTGEDLAELATLLSVSLDTLQSAIQSETVERTVQADLATGISLGVHFTPCVFINGVEIQGAASDPANVRIAINRLQAEIATRAAAGNPVAAHFADHRPLAAAERLLASWEQVEQVAQLPDPQSCQHVLGPANAQHRIILYLEPSSFEAGGMYPMLHELVAMRDDVRVDLYLSIISRELNPRFADYEKDYFPRSTQTTRLLKAVHQIAGDTAFDATFAWVASTGKAIPIEELSAKLIEANVVADLTKEQLLAAMQSEEVELSIAADLAAAKIAEITWTPYLIINGRISPDDNVDAATVSKMLDLPKQHAE